MNNNNTIFYLREFKWSAAVTETFKFLISRSENNQSQIIILKLQQ